ncbi:MAG: hypothetical protein HKP16_11770 [Xanthomonadales bacterium]|nr:hypothetical protein [Xanthomonadales bacterium]
MPDTAPAFIRPRDFSFTFEESQAIKGLHRLEPDLLLSRGYTGAYLGLYATANGGSDADHADFDWVRLGFSPLNP